MSDHAHDHDPNAVGHVVSMKILVGVWLALMVLTYVTVAATYIDLGEFNFPLAMLIATVKAALVCLYFMHLRWDKPFNTIVFVSSLGFVALFIGLVLTDKHEYHEDEIPGYAPLIEEEKR